MENAEIKELLCKQLKLLASVSENSATCEELAQLTEAMLQIVSCLNAMKSSEQTNAYLKDSSQRLGLKL